MEHFLDVAMLKHRLIQVIDGFLSHFFLITSRSFGITY